MSTVTKPAPTAAEDLRAEAEQIARQGGLFYRFTLAQFDWLMSTILPSGSTG